MKFLLLLLLIAETASAMEPTLIGGRVAKPGDFPEVVYITSGRSRCSATLIGEHVLITAAHCISDGGEVGPVAEFVINQQVFKAKCSHHPEYASKYSYDFALCKTKNRVDVKYASIAKRAVTLGEEATLMGYGCVNPKNDNGGGDGGNDGKLRYGEATINRLPGSGVGGGQYFETSDNTALCFGDSGGPAMLLIEDPKEEMHEISGINSRGDIRKRSLLSATHPEGFQNWAKAWAMANDVMICGINKDCYNDDPDPDPDPEEDEECIEPKYMVWRYTKWLKKWEMKLDECLNESIETLPYLF